MTSKEIIMIEYENTIDIYLVSAIDMLYTDKLSKLIKNTLVELHHYEEYDTLEEDLVGLIADNTADESSIADSILTTIITFSSRYLEMIGVKLTENKLSVILSILITFKELQQLSHETALELSTIVSDDEMGEIYMLSSLVAYYTDEVQIDVYIAIEYVKPSIVRDIITIIDKSVEDVYVESDSVNESLNTSYIYNNYIKGIDIKVPYTTLLEVLVSFCNTTTDVKLISREVKTVLTYSLGIENELHFLKTVIAEDLEEVFMDTPREHLLEDIINTTVNIDKG